MSVLKLKDERGNWVGIPTIKGDKGDDGTYVEGNPNVDATDGDLTKIKIDNKIYSIHNYTSALDGKLDKKTTTGYYAYTHDGTTQAELAISQSNDGSTLVQRNSAGQITAAAPTDTTHCATKGYVDGAVSGKQDTLVSGTNIKTVNGQSILGSGNIEIQGGGTNIPAIEITDGFSGDVTDKNNFDTLTDIYNNRKFSLVYQVTTEGDYVYYSYAGQRLDDENMGHILFNYTDDKNGTLSSIDYNADTGHWIKNETTISKTKMVPNNGPTSEDGTNLPGIQVATYQTTAGVVFDIVTIIFVTQVSYAQDGVIKCVVPGNLFAFDAPHNNDYGLSMFGNPSVIDTPSSWIIKNLNVQWDGVNTTLRFQMGKGPGSGGGMFRINFRL